MHRNRPIGSRANQLTYSEREVRRSFVISMLITLFLTLNFAPIIVHHYVNVLVDKPNQSIINKLKSDENADLKFVNGVGHIQLVNPEIITGSDGKFTVKGVLNGSTFQTQTTEQPTITNGVTDLYQGSSSGSYYVNADKARNNIKQNAKSAIDKVQRNVVVTRTSLSTSLVLLACVISLSAMFVIYVVARFVFLMSKTVHVTKVQNINPF